MALLSPAGAVTLALSAPIASPQSVKGPPKDPRVDDGVVFVKDLVGDAEGAPPADRSSKSNPRP